MAVPPFHNVHPEILDAFLGKAPLESAQKHFATRQELLQAYANMQAALFGAATARGDKCDLCEQFKTPVAWLQVEWDARVKWHPWRALLIVPFLPVGVFLAWTHLSLIFHSYLKRTRIELVEVLTFETWYGVCPSCRWWLRIRSFFWWAAALTGATMLLFSGGGILYAGILLTGTAVGAWNNGPGLTTLQTVWILLGSILCFVSLLTIGRHMLRRIMISRSMRRLVKSPFHAEGIEMHRRKPAGMP